MEAGECIRQIYLSGGFLLLNMKEASELQKTVHMLRGNHAEIGSRYPASHFRVGHHRCWRRNWFKLRHTRNAEAYKSAESDNM